MAQKSQPAASRAGGDPFAGWRAGAPGGPQAGAAPSSHYAGCPRRHPSSTLCFRDMVPHREELWPSASALSSHHHPERRGVQLAASLTYLASHGQALGCLLQSVSWVAVQKWEAELQPLPSRARPRGSASNELREANACTWAAARALAPPAGPQGGTGGEVHGIHEMGESSITVSIKGSFQSILALASGRSSGAPAGPRRSPLQDTQQSSLVGAAGPGRSKGLELGQPPGELRAVWAVLLCQALGWECRVWELRLLSPGGGGEHFLQGSGLAGSGCAAGAGAPTPGPGPGLIAAGFVSTTTQRRQGAEILQVLQICPVMRAATPS